MIRLMVAVVIVDRLMVAVVIMDRLMVAVVIMDRLMVAVFFIWCDVSLIYEGHRVYCKNLES